MLYTITESVSGYEFIFQTDHGNEISVYTADNGDPELVVIDKDYEFEIDDVLLGVFVVASGDFMSLDAVCKKVANDAPELIAEYEQEAKDWADHEDFESARCI